MEGFKLRADIIFLATGLSLMTTGIGCWFWMWPVFPMTLDFSQLSLAASVEKWSISLGALLCLISGVLRPLRSRRIRV